MWHAREWASLPRSVSGGQEAGRTMLSRECLRLIGRKSHLRAHRHDVGSSSADLAIEVLEAGHRRSLARNGLLSFARAGLSGPGPSVPRPGPSCLRRRRYTTWFRKAFARLTSRLAYLRQETFVPPAWIIRTAGYRRQNERPSIRPTHQRLARLLQSAAMDDLGQRARGGFRSSTC